MTKGAGWGGVKILWWGRISVLVLPTAMSVSCHFLIFDCGVATSVKRLGRQEDKQIVWQ